jgi:hypothetical protein
LAGGKIQEQSGDKLVSLNLRVRGAKGQCRRMVQHCGLCGKEAASSEILHVARDSNCCLDACSLRTGLLSQCELANVNIFQRQTLVVLAMLAQLKKFLFPADKQL